jgi:hypothetical protein
MVVNDPEMTLPDGTVSPAGPMHGQTVTVEKQGDNMSIVRSEDGQRQQIGNNLLKPVAALQRVAETDRPDNPRQTPEDRASPLQNDLIDDGKKIFEEALGGKGGMVPRDETRIEINGRRATDLETDIAVAADLNREFGTLSPPAAPPARGKRSSGLAGGACNGPWLGHRCRSITSCRDC